MVKTLRPKVGLLALTLELYEKLAPDLRQERENWVQREVIPALQPKADVLFGGARFRAEDIASALADFETADADAILVLLLSYSPSQFSLPGLQRARLPIVIWNTQELFVANQNLSPADLRHNHGVHGTQDLANVLLRAGVPFHYVTSHLQDANALEELNDFFMAAVAVRRLRSAKLGLLGYPFPGMGDIAADATQMLASLGCRSIVLKIEDYIQAAATAPAGFVSEVVQNYRDQYAIDPDITEADLQSTARVELGLRAMLATEHLQGFSYQFLALGEDERTPTLPFVAASRLMAEGFGFGGEGDLISTAATAFLNWLNPPATFSEIFTIDFAGNALLMSHMGEANAAMARRDRKISLVARPVPITRTRDRQLALVTSLEPGPATFVALALGPKQQWRFIAAPVTVEDFGPLPTLAVPHFKIKPVGDVREFLTAYGRAGGPHHNAICFGDARRRLRLAATILGIDYIEI